MQDLIQKLMANGLTEEQAIMAANTTRDYIKGKVPTPFAGIVDNFLAGQSNPADAMKNAATAQSDWMSKAKETAQDASEKITDFTHEAIDKGADFAKDASKKMNDWAGKAGDVAEDAIEKLKEMLGHKEQSKPGDTSNQNKEQK
jgi:uncharacterized protein YoaH (UPF0181 family)